MRWGGGGCWKGENGGRLGGGVKKAECKREEVRGRVEMLFMQEELPISD